jgi:hypothetical protein
MSATIWKKEMFGRTSTQKSNESNNPSSDAKAKTMPRDHFFRKKRPTKRISR